MLSPEHQLVILSTLRVRFELTFTIFIWCIDYEPIAGSRLQLTVALVLIIHYYIIFLLYYIMQSRISNYIICSNCNVELKKRQSEINKSKSGNHFCSSSCAATYNNKQRTRTTQQIKLICHRCNSTFLRSKSRHDSNTKVNYCSNNCLNVTDQTFHCYNCESLCIRSQAEIRKNKSGRYFCSKSCRATYNNKNKAFGITRSKLEIYLEYKLQSELPHLKFQSNSKKVIGSELDFFFPDLMLAIEINGPTHYKPIYGLKKLKQIKNNDISKAKACQDASIRLGIITNLKTFSEHFGSVQWNCLLDILDAKLTLST